MKPLLLSLAILVTASSATLGQSVPREVQIEALLSSAQTAYEKSDFVQSQNDLERAIKLVVSVGDIEKFATISEKMARNERDIQNRDTVDLIIKSGHSSTRLAVEFSSTAKLAASFADKQIKLWDLATGEVIATLEGHLNPIESVAFSPDGTLLASSARQEIRIWDVKTAREIRSIKFTAYMVIFSPDGEELVAGGMSGEIKSFDVKRGNDESYYRVFKGHEDQINSLAFSPDGKTLASSSGKTLFSDKKDYTVRLWDFASSKELKKFVSDQSVGTIAFSHDGKTIASAGFDTSVALWNVGTGEKSRTLNIKSGFANSLSFSSDGAFLAAGSNEGITSWDLVKGQTRSVASENGANSVKFLPGSHSLISSGSDEIELWDNDSLAVTNKFRGQKVQAAFLVKESKDGRLYGLLENSLWDLREGKVLFKFAEDTSALDFSIEKGLIAGGIGINDQIKEVGVWSTQTGLKLKSFAAGNADCRFSADASLIACSEFTGPIRVWSLTSGKEIVHIKNENELLQTIDLSTDGKYLLINRDYKEIVVWDIAANRELRKFDDDDLEIGTRPQSDGKIVVALARKMYTTPEGFELERVMRIWEISTGKVETITNRNFAAAMTIDGDVVFPNINNKRLLVHANGQEITYYELGTGKKLGSFIVFGEKDWVFATPDGLFDGTLTGWKSLLWRFDSSIFNNAPVEAFFKEFYRPGLLEETMKGKPPQPALTNLSQIDIRQPIVKITEVDSRPITSINPNVTGKRTGQFSIEIQDNSSPGRKPDFSAAAGARDLRLFRNGSLVKVWRGDLFDKASGCMVVETKANEPRRVRCTAEVAVVAGENRFTAYAFNSSNVKSNDAEAVVEGKAAKRDGTLYVLAVGVDKYAASDRSKGADYDLNYAVADIDAIGKELTAQQAALKQKQYSDTKVISIKNENATKANILLALKRFAKDGDGAAMPEGIDPKLREELAKIKTVQPEDALVIYYAGHGTARCVLDEKSKQTNCDRFYLIPTDGFPSGTFADEKSRKDSLYEHSISDEELSSALETVDAGKMMMVIDACNSGAIEGEETRRGPMNSRGLAQLAYEKGMDVLTASQSLQSAQEGLKIKDKQGNIVEMGHGLLTYALLQAFKDKDANKDNDDKLTQTEWLTYAATQVPQLQLEAMKYRSAEVRSDTTKKRAELVFVNGDDKNLPPEKRGLQTPRLFTRRESDLSPIVVANWR